MPELASFSESSRKSALQRFQLLRAHLEGGRSLAAIAREPNISNAAALAGAISDFRLAALARKPRIDRGRRRKLSAALQEAIALSARLGTPKSTLCGLKVSKRNG
jgi:hypothetical protein